MKIPGGFFLLTLAFIFVVTFMFYYAVELLSKRTLAKVLAWLVIILDVVTFSAFMPAGRELVAQYLADEQIALLIQIFSVLLMMQIIFSVLVFLDHLYIKGKERLHIPVDEGRRRFLKKGFVFPVAALGAGVYATTYEREQTVIREISVPTKNLPENLYGFRMAQLSDVHLGLFYSIDKLRELLEKTTELEAQALLLTGDVFDDVNLNEEAAMVIDEYVPKFPKGIFFCFGNHEHIRGIKKIKAILQKTRIKVLNNSSILIKDGERPLYFAGVDYPMARHAFDMLALSYMDDAMRGIPENAVTVLLAHHPDFIDQGAERNVSLVLSGHTHGGQIGALGIPLAPPVFKYMRGAYRVRDTFGYVHSGNGSWFPYRLGCPPEIACFSFCEEG